MTAKREICITLDPYAYDTTEIDNYVIAAGYDTANDWINYQAPAHSHTPVFKTLRATAHADSGKADEIREEATDQVAPASLFGGTRTITGTIKCAYRGWDFHTSGLLKGIMGDQTPASVANPATGFATGYRYEFTMVPESMAIKIVDNNAKNADNSIGATKVYRGVGISGTTISLAIKTYADTDITWMARKEEVFDAPYNTNVDPTGDPKMFYNAVLKWTPEGGSESVFRASSFNIQINRPIDTEDFLLGSQFLGSLTYNGITDLGGTINCSPSEWDKIRAMMVGSNSTLINTLDQGKQEFTGVVTNSTTSTVLANPIPSGKLEILLHKTDGSQVVDRFTISSCKLTEASVDVTGVQRPTKSITWKGVVNNSNPFYVDTWLPV